MFVAVGGLLVVALFGALIAPYFIDWSVYKRDFEREASLIFGQPVKVDGDAQVRLLPMPSVTFHKLQVGGNEDGTPMTTVDEFFMAAELMPFLSGEIRVKEMKLVRPKVTILLDENGTIEWGDREETLSKFGLKRPDLDNLASVKLENVSVEDGQIIIVDQSSNRELTVLQMYAGIKARSLLGPWHMDASGIVNGVQTRFTINTGAYQKEGSIRIKLLSERIDQPYRMLIDGPVSLKDGLLAWDGSFKIDPMSGDALDRAKEAEKPLPAWVSGTFEANPKNITIPEYRLQIGDREDPYLITGQGGIDVAEKIFFRLQADGRQLDLSKLEDGEEKKTPRLEDRLAAVKTILNSIPLPDADGEISIELPAIVAGDTLIREVSAVVRPVDAGWDVHSLRMTLPGNTVFEANGRLGLGDSFGFDGQVLLASRQPSGFAAWISGKVDRAVRRLSSVGLAAKVTISPNQTTLDNLELVLDTAILRGKIQRIAVIDGRPGIIASLNGDLVNLDDLRAIYALTQGGTADESAAFAGHDLDLRLNAKELRGKAFGENLRASNVNTHVRVQKGSLAIEKLDIGSFFGTSVASSGRISDLLDKPNGNVKFNIRAKSGTEFAQLLQRLVGQNPLLDALAETAKLSENSNLNIEIDSTSGEKGSKGQALISGVVGGTSINTRIGFNGRASAIRDMELDINGSFENETPHILLQQSGLEVLPLDTPGPLSIQAEIAGIARKGLLTLISASAPGSDVTANGLMTLSGDGKSQGKFDVTLGSKDIQPFLLLSGLAVPGLSLLDAVPVSLTSEVGMKRSGMEFKKLSGQISGNKYSGGLNVAKLVAARPKMTGKIHFDTLSIPLLQNLVLGSQADQKDEKALFNHAFLQGLDGDVDVSANLAVLGVGERAQGYSSQLVVLDGNINLNAVSMAWMGGNLSGNLSIRNTAGAGQMSGQYQLAEGKLDQLFAAVGKAPFMTGVFDSAGTFNGSGRSKKALLSGLGGSGIFAVKNGEIPGLNPDAFSQILLATDVDGFEIETERVGEIADAAVFGQSFHLGDYSEAFSLVQGNLVLRNVSVETDELRLSAKASLNLASMKTDASVQIVYQAGKEAVAGAAPEVRLDWTGNFPQLSMSLDTQALEGYLSVRAYEREQRRVELLQAAILEKQRLRREIIRTNARANYKIYLRKQEELVRIKAEEELLRLIKLEETLDKKRRKEEEARLKALDALARQQRKLEAEQAKKLAATKRQRERKAAEAKKREIARIKRNEAEATKRQKELELAKRKLAVAAKKRRENEQVELRRKAISARIQRTLETEQAKKDDKKKANDAFKRLLDLAEKQRLDNESTGGVRGLGGDTLRPDELKSIERGGVVRRDLDPLDSSSTNPKSDRISENDHLDRKRLLQELDKLLFNN
ncbi:MAG: AsmA-like C-terminal region-containing protein [Rhizobiaceae bacterium]